MVVRTTSTKIVAFFTVLWIRWSIPLTYGSRIQILFFSSVAFKMPTKNLFFLK